MSEKIGSLYAEIGADTKGLKRGLDETKSGLQDAKRGFTDFKTSAFVAFGVVTSAIVTAKKVFDMGKEGAQLEFVRGKFDRLAESVGTTSDALLTDLKMATRGTRSDMELVTSAADFLSLGLAKSKEEVVRLTRVAGALGMNMNQLVLTLTNQTTMRFDALGVSVDGFDERLEDLKKTGMDTNAAFTEAFLQQAEEQIGLVGDVADSAAGDIMRMEAEVANLSDTLKMRLAPAVAETAGALADYLASAETTAELTKESSKLVDDYSMRYVRLNDRVMKQVIATNSYNQAEKAATGSVRDAFRVKDDLVGVTKDYTDATEDNTEAVDDNTEAVKRNELHQGILEGRVDKLRLLIDGPVGDAYDDFTKRNTELWEETVILKDKIADLEKRKYLTKEQKEELKEAKKKLDEVSQAATANADAHDEATSRILLNLLEQQLAIGGWTDEEFMFLQEVANRWGLIDDKTLEATQGMQRALNEFSKSKDVSDAADALDMIKAKVLGIPTDINVNVRVRYSEGGGVGGGSPTDWKDKKPRQLGGYISKGMPYIVGEQGPEMIIPNQSGMVVNNWNLTANYASRDRDSLALDVRMLQALYG